MHSWSLLLCFKTIIKKIPNTTTHNSVCNVFCSSQTKKMLLTNCFYYILLEDSSISVKTSKHIRFIALWFMAISDRIYKKPFPVKKNPCEDKLDSPAIFYHFSYSYNGLLVFLFRFRFERSLKQTIPVIYSHMNT